MADEDTQNEKADVQPVQKPAVAGRPNDIAPGAKVSNSTFAERAAAARKLESKAVQSDGEVENKAVKAAKTRKK